jgi:hypothetical protein
VYTGHVGIALALRGERDAPPLWVLVLTAQGPDWGDLLLSVLGRADSDGAYGPHSFVMIGVGAVVFALGAGAVARRSRAPVGRAMLITALAYVSHWIADYFTGIKPTWPGGPLVGLGLYFHWRRDLLLEAAVVSVGWWLWGRRLPGGRGPLARALLVGLIALQLVANVMMARSAGFL